MSERNLGTCLELKLPHERNNFCHHWMALRTAEAPAPSQTEASDACECGDYRSDHDQKGCRVCGNSRAPYDGCKSFRLSRKANEAEQKHWDEFHGPNAGYDGEDHTPDPQAAQAVASPKLVDQARTYFQREYDRDPKQSIFVGMANFASIHAATIAAERDRQYEYNLDQLVKITQLEDRIAELIEQNSPPSHTEGHIDCPACDRNRWDVLRKGK